MRLQVLTPSSETNNGGERRGRNGREEQHRGGGGRVDEMERSMEVEWIGMERRMWREVRS